tara:strand:- start:2289 stop:2600 length:312 start_codon:yes stop_codon:yes gene_type:complete
MFEGKEQKLSGSNSTEIDIKVINSVSALQVQVDILKIQVEDLSMVVKCLTDTNSEMSKDMQRIFGSLKDVTSLLVEEDYADPDDPFASMMMSFFPKKDDDLLN